MSSKNTTTIHKYTENIKINKLYTYTLNLKTIISPSCTTYSFPSSLTCHFSLAAFHVPCVASASYETTSALINHFSKSVCIAHAACGALLSIGIVQALDSFSPVVK